MKSIDVSHVPAPDPAYFWWFEKNNKLNVTNDGKLSLQLIAIDAPNNRAMFNLIVNDKPIRDYLEIDAPCVAIRTESLIPMLTLTLREIAAEKVAVQVTANMTIFETMPRSV